MQQDILQELFRQVERKFIINRATKDRDDNNGIPREAWTSHEIYLKGIFDEIEEAKKEIKANNHVYLEDELGDIMWVYMNILYFLEKEWLIGDKEACFERCLKKFKERNNWLEAWKVWDEIKQEQKQELLDEHNKKYS